MPAKPKQPAVEDRAIPMGSKWYHPKGWFSITVLSADVSLVTYIIDQHCDNTFAHAAAAEDGDGLVQRGWFEDNTVKCMTRERFFTTFTPTAIPYTSPPIHHYDHKGQLIVEVQPPAAIL